MICPYIINISVLLGGILSWGIMWPLIETTKGHWYKADLPPSNMHGLQGYKVIANFLREHILTSTYPAVIHLCINIFPFVPTPGLHCHRNDFRRWSIQFLQGA